MVATVVRTERGSAGLTATEDVMGWPSRRYRWVLTVSYGLQG